MQYDVKPQLPGRVFPCARRRPRRHDGDWAEGPALRLTWGRVRTVFLDLRLRVGVGLGNSTWRVEMCAARKVGIDATEHYAKVTDWSSE